MDEVLKNRIKELVLNHAKRLAPERGSFAGKELWQAVRRTGTRLWPASM